VISLTASDIKSAREAELVRLGARVRQLRSQAGLTSVAVAEAIGVHRTTLERFERGEHDLGASSLRLLVDALGTDTSALLDG
jgi:transcriptional regulator with XRE-family HTH domain